MFWKNTYNEFIKIFSKPRSFIGLGAITIIVGILLYAIHKGGLDYISFITKPFEQSLAFEGKILNGNLIAFFILQILIIHVPLLIALVTGDLISGEAAMGTIRLLLTKPISRNSILFSKYIAGCAYTFFLLLWLMIMALGFGKIIFGTGDLIVLKSDGIVILQQQDLPWRFCCAFGVAYLSLVTIATLSLTLSCFSENSIGPIVSTMAIIIVFNIVGALNVAAFEKIKPLLFTEHMIAWRSIFDDPLPKKELLTSIFVLLVHIFGLLGIASYKFNKKDILS